MRCRGAGSGSTGVRSNRTAAGALRALVAGAMVLALASCASAPAQTGAPSTPAPATPTADQLVTCADLVSTDVVAGVLAAEPADVVEAVQPSDAVDLETLTGAGGLACSWRVGAGQQIIGDGQGDWAYLSIDLLPDAADEWVAPYAGDSPSDRTRTIAGIEATTATGETGWRVSAPVGSTWVDLSITASGLTGTGSRFDGTPAGEVLDNLATAAASVFPRIEAASDAQLAWPHLAFRDGDAACDGGLAEAGIVSALGYDDAVVTYTAMDPRQQPVMTLADAAQARLGVFTCELFAEGFGYTDVLVVRGGASIIDELASAKDISAALEPIALTGAVDGESALVARREDGPRSPVYFTVGETFYAVSSGDGPVIVAEAIIAQTR